MGIFAHNATRMSTTRVEIPQQGAVPLLKRLIGLLQVVPLGLDVVCDDILDHRLCASVCVGGPNGAVLRDGNHVGYPSRVAIDCSG